MTIRRIQSGALRLEAQCANARCRRPVVRTLRRAAVQFAPGRDGRERVHIVIRTECLACGSPLRYDVEGLASELV